MPFVNSSAALKNAQTQQRLVAEGMSYPESAAAIEAGIREGRSVGSAAEERARAALRAAVPVSVSLPAVEAGSCNVLIIEGMGAVGEDVNFISDNLEKNWKNRAGTKKDSLVRLSFAHGSRANARDACRRAVDSGHFHAVVVADLADGHEAFEEHLGPPLHAFATRGGVVVFQSSEGMALLPTLKRLFHTQWESSGYYRTTWEPVVDMSGRRTFATASGQGLPVFHDYSAKACTVRNVPPGERLYATKATSRTQSMVPGMANRAVGHRTEPDSVLAGVEGDDFDVCVAAHAHGDGFVVYCGDVNGEAQTAVLVAACCHASQIRLPPAAASPAEPPPAAPSTPSSLKADYPLQSLGKVVGLQSRPKLNGEVARVMGYQGERLKVKMGGFFFTNIGSVELALRPDNLQRGDQATLRREMDAPHYFWLCLLIASISAMFYYAQ